MFLHDGKEYFPLEIEKIIGRGETVIYDRDKRGKAYFYIDLTVNKELKTKEGN